VPSALITQSAAYSFVRRLPALAGETWKRMVGELFFTYLAAGDLNFGMDVCWVSDCSRALGEEEIDRENV